MKNIKKPLDNKQVNITQTNYNDGCGCGTLIGVIGLFALGAYAIQALGPFGPIFTALIGALIGLWGALKLCGYNIDDVDHIDVDNLGTFETILLSVGLLGGLIAGFAFGRELINELEDNAQLIIHIKNTLLT